MLHLNFVQPNIAMPVNVKTKGNALSKQLNNDIKVNNSAFIHNTNIYYQSSLINRTKLNFCGKEHLELPTDKVEKLFNQSLQKIYETNNPEDKAYLCEEALTKAEKLSRNYHSSITKKITKEENYMLDGDFLHETSGQKIDFSQNYFWPIEFKNSDNPKIRKFYKPLPPDFDKICKNTFSEIVDTYKRYQFFIDKGLINSNQTSLPSILNLAMELVENRAKSKNIKLSIKGKDLLENPDVIRLTKDYKTYTIFSNLLQNAVKYTPINGSIEAEFSLKKTPDDYSLLNFSVQDNGIGIPPEETEKVINGERASNAVKSGIHGTGHGLDRIRKILKFIPIKDNKITIISPVNPDAPDRPGTKIICPIAVLQHKKD